MVELLYETPSAAGWARLTGLDWKPALNRFAVEFAERFPR